MDQHVQFVIHNPDSDVVDPSAINQIEVSSNNVLAHIPQDVLNVAATTTVVDKIQQNASQQQQQVTNSSHSHFSYRHIFMIVVFEPGR